MAAIFSSRVFQYRQQTLKIFRVATHKRTIRQSGIITKVDGDKHVEYFLMGRQNVSRLVTSAKKRDVTNRCLHRQKRASGRESAIGLLLCCHQDSSRYQDAFASLAPA